MCTVTFIPSKDRYFLSSSRDETIMRKPAIPPQYYFENNSRLLYPKDATAGGSWIAMKDNGHAAVLLNGAFVKHVPLPSYRRSRGLVCIDIISAAMPARYFYGSNLFQVAPFTLILIDNNRLYECRWDGSNKYCKQLSQCHPYIWSSVTLYNKDNISKREQWFTQWLTLHPYPVLEDIMQFHQLAGDGDAENDVLMNRNNKMLTVSITGMEISRDKGSIVYKDLKTAEIYNRQLAFITERVVQ